MAAAAIVSNLSRAGKSALILDSATSGRERLVRSFQELGFHVWAAEELETALTLVEQRVPQLVLVDISIGGGQGLRLVQRLRATWPESDTIVLTAQASIATAVRTMRAGAATYLVKPATALQILESVSVEPGLPKEELRPATLTLDRVIWEYIREVVETAGSISEASRRLGVERHSLRRMLVKYSPHD